VIAGLALPGRVALRFGTDQGVYYPSMDCQEGF
jgi:hypothetical protein